MQKQAIGIGQAQKLNNTCGIHSNLGRTRSLAGLHVAMILSLHNDATVKART